MGKIKCPKPRGPVPPYDRRFLLDSLEKHVALVGVKSALDLGVYHHVPMAHAVRSHGLLVCRDLLKALLAAAPAGQILYSVPHLGFDNCTGQFDD